MSGTRYPPHAAQGNDPALHKALRSQVEPSAGNVFGARLGPFPAALTEIYGSFGWIHGLPRKLAVADIGGTRVTSARNERTQPKATIIQAKSESKCN